MAYLVIRNNDHEVLRRQLSASLTLGRAAECDLCLPEPTLSRHHCCIEYANDRWVLRDLESKNGTYVNGRRADRHELESGDTFRIGEWSVTYYAGLFADAQPAAAVAAEQGGYAERDLADELILPVFDDMPVNRAVAYRDEDREAPALSSGGSNGAGGLSRLLGLFRHSAPAPAFARH